MSSIHGIGDSSFDVRGVSGATAASAPAAARPVDSDGDHDGDTLKAVQGLLKQLETGANAKAIPAHQNW